MGDTEGRSGEEWVDLEGRRRRGSPQPSPQTPELKAQCRVGPEYRPCPGTLGGDFQPNIPGACSNEYHP